MDKKKLSVNSIILLLLGISATILLVAFIIIFAVTYKPVIAFYNVPKASKSAIQKIILENTNTNFKYVDLDNTKPLSSQSKNIKKAKLLFALQDCDSKEFSTSSIFKNIDASLLETMPTTIASSVNVKNNIVKYLPVMYDFYQIDVNYDFYQKTNTKNLTFWSDLTSVLEKEIEFATFPLVFDGNQNDTFIDIVGMLYEAFSTPEEYENFLESLYRAFKIDLQTPGNLQDYLSALPSTSDTFNKVFAELKNLKNSGCLKNTVLQNNLEDSIYLLNENLCGIYFTTLYNHRLINRDVISNYKSIYCPSYEKNTKRKFCAPETAVFCIKNNKTTKKLIQILAVQQQTALSSYAGIAPVNRECTVSDIQAGDVRYWLAASSGPLLPLSAALPSQEAKKIAANYLQSLLQ